jgi:hypothetical protein
MRGAPMGTIYTHPGRYRIPDSPRVVADEEMVR